MLRINALHLLLLLHRVKKYAGVSEGSPIPTVIPVSNAFQMRSVSITASWHGVPAWVQGRNGQQATCS
jgi:hypothetical protein